MATGQLDTLMRHIQEAAAGCAARHQTDCQLLDDFAARRDESAFAALLSRHGPMVLRVCRRLLRHEQDAEDAFQATFLVLAQQAGTIRQRETLAGWLYGVAFRTAAQAKRKAARRRAREARLRGRTPPAAPSPTWDDVQAVLDEEVLRLPESLRSAFILCVLDGKTVPAAAAELGAKEGTVSWRLARARQRLRLRLARRGIELTGLLAALSVAQSGRAGVPDVLTQATIQLGLRVATGGSVAATLPSHVAQLAKGVTRAMSLTKAARIATAALLAVALVAGVGARSLVAVALGKPSVEGQKPAAAPARAAALAPAVQEKGNSALVSGRVVGPDGKPVSGAKVFFARNVLAFERASPPPLPPAAAADARGRFRLRVSRTGYLFAEEKADWLQGGVVAVAPGYGPGWVYNDSAEKLADVTIKLVKDVPIKGRVRDLEGKPVAGVSVRVKSYYLGEGDLKEWLKALEARKEGHGVHSLGGMNPAYQLGLGRPVVTAKDGTFRLTGVGAERVVALRFEGPTIATSEVYVVTRPCQTVVLPRVKKKPGLGSYVYHGPTFEHVVAPTMPILGTIRARDTGKPLAGVTVRAHLDSAYGYYTEPENYIRATSDKEGKYRLVGLPRVAGQYLWVTPAAGQPYLPPERATAGVSSGTDPLRVDFALKRGVLIRGRVTDKVTGQPVAARVEYMAFEDNPHLKGGGVLRGVAYQVRTNPNGSFTIAGLPGRGLLAAKATYKEMEGYHPNSRYLLDVGADKIKGQVVTHGPWPARQFHAVVEIDPAQGKALRQDIVLVPKTKESSGEKNRR